MRQNSLEDLLKYSIVFIHGAQKFVFLIPFQELLVKLVVGKECYK